MHLSSPIRAGKCQILLKGISASDKGHKTGCKQPGKRKKQIDGVDEEKCEDSIILT
jgi:hypothetical protein